MPHMVHTQRWLDDDYLISLSSRGPNRDRGVGWPGLNAEIFRLPHRGTRSAEQARSAGGSRLALATQHCRFGTMDNFNNDPVFGQNMGSSS